MFLHAKLCNYLFQVPAIYKEMEYAGCTPDRKAREMLEVALMVLEQRPYKY